MTIRIHSPFQLSEPLQQQINDQAERLQRFFDRIISTEVYFQETPAGQTKLSSKEVALKVHIMRRVLYASECAKNYEDALRNVIEKMRQQLKAYENEMKIY
ncbi:MAG: HPF/RaiA family ribosome-associated protein [Saprospiraceae bacterium]|nr:HPF/RaiA family ribosome-associated protein [Saprospiraceae bacterium]